MYTDYDGELIPEATEGIKRCAGKILFEKSQALRDSYENIKLLFSKEYLTTHPNDRIS
jgi:hypothetical protein